MTCAGDRTHFMRKMAPFAGRRRGRNAYAAVAKMGSAAANRQGLARAADPHVVGAQVCVDLMHHIDRDNEHFIYTTEAALSLYQRR